MAEIKVLSQEVADKIAAGEVAERPSAVVKELVENSIDAGADRISVEIKNGGIRYIRIEDNGKGIPADELECAFLRHATSKLRDIDDLYSLHTMGFRGEALASICAVSDMEVISRTESEEEGAYLSLVHGAPSKKESAICNRGTTMIVQNLFANIPARMKFMKKDSTEAGYVTDVVGRIALSRPDIAFSYICDGKEIFSTTGDGQLKNAVLKIYGIDYAKGAVEVNHTEHGVRVTGVAGKPELARGNRARQTLFVNGRYIKNHVVSKVVEEAYRNSVMVGRFPFFVLNIDLAPELVDVNVHPAKTEIKLANEKEIYEIVYRAVKNALYSGSAVALPEKREPVPQTADAAEAVTAQPVQELDGNGAQPQAEKSAFPSAVRGTDGFGEYNPGHRELPPDRKIISEFMKNTAVQTYGGAFRFNSPNLTDEGRGSGAAASGAASYAKTEFAAADGMTDLSSPEKITDEPEEIKIVGQVFDTYVIFQQGESMYMIDQHAAHERRRFETLRRDYKSRSICGQVLLVPVVLDVDSTELQIIREHTPEFSGFGFLIEEFGPNSVIIRETPLAADDETIKNLVLEIVSVLRDGRPNGLLSFEERALDMISCKYAIKANKKLSDIEIKALVDDVAALEREGITTCPHGRPIKVEFSKKSIEKMFKRIV